MKSKLSIVLGVLLFCSYFLIKENMHSKHAVFDIAFANLEALSQGEDGTAVGTCYRQGETSGDFRFRYVCDSRTTENRIYPCPKNQEYSVYNKSDRCTK